MTEHVAPQGKGDVDRSGPYQAIGSMIETQRNTDTGHIEWRLHCATCAIISDYSDDYVSVIAEVNIHRNGRTHYKYNRG